MVSYIERVAFYMKLSRTALEDYVKEVSTEAQFNRTEDMSHRELAGLAVKYTHDDRIDEMVENDYGEFGEFWS